MGMGGWPRVLLLVLSSMLSLSGCSLLAGNQVPVAVIEASPTRGEAPLVVEFDGSRSFDPDGLIVRYEWDFGEGTRAEGPRVSHVYQRNGIYLATLRVSDQFGSSDQDRVRIVVGNPPPQAIFAASPTSGWPPLTVNFDASASFDPEGEPLQYEWDFGDGADARGKRVTHVYPSAGRFTVRLTVRDRDGAASSATLVVAVLDFLRLPPVRSTSSPLDGLLRDLDGDGRLDLAVVSSESDELTLFFGRQESGSFTFIQGESFAVGRRPVALAAGDFDGDGFLDLATAKLESGSVSLWRNEGGRRFRAAAEMRLGQWTTALAAADFDDDGRTDLAVADVGRDEVVVLLGDGTGNFQLAGSIRVGRWPAALVPADLNGDGFLDLAVANFLGNSLTLLFGDGLGRFRAGGTLSVGAGPAALAAADLDGDGFLDLICANALSSSLSLLMGRGAGRFDSALEVKVGEGVRALATADFDGDGSLDLAAANSGEGSVTIFLNDGLGRFGRPEQAKTFPLAGGPTALAAGDLDQDGSLDLVVLQFGAKRISILLNQLAIP